MVDRATGGSSIQDGQVEMMLHRFDFDSLFISISDQVIPLFQSKDSSCLVINSRRLLVDDGRGVGEALDETVCISNNTCQGLTV